MNITELDSFNLADAVKFHDRLNPRLWGRDEHLLPEVQEKLLAIAADFQEFLGVPDLDVEDITISGSNAAYSYTPASDIDLHLVVRMPQQNSEVFQELFNAKKYQYNDEHDIRIGGADVELYVQPSDQAHHSLGIYSLKNNDWVSVPRRRRIALDDQCVAHKTEDLGARIDQAVKSGNESVMSRLWDKIKTMRQTGLEQSGEFGCDNLVFKMLKRSGHIERLKQAKTQAHDQALSLKEQPKKPITYGFRTSGDYRNLFKQPNDQENKKDNADVRFNKPQDYEWFRQQQDKKKELASEGHQGQPYSSEDGVAPSTCMFLNETDDASEQMVKDFIQDTANKLGIKDMPKIYLHRDDDWAVNKHSFGMYEPETHTLHVNLAGRHIMDILRTTAHELAHCRQHELSALPATAGDTGSPWENEAHAVAGIIMRDWADAHPELFDQGILESASGYIPTKKQARDPRYSMALTVDIKPGQVGKEANKMALKTDSQGRPGLLMKTANMIGESKIKDLNDPPGPEFRPTMPRGTVRVDVSDMYDWYKLGRDFANLDRANPAAYGKGPPSTIVSFGDEETEHKYIKNLKKLGLSTTDIDPVDPNQPASMPRQSTDPTYNVDESEKHVGEQDVAESDDLVESLRQEFELLENEFISEIKMSPSSLRQEAAKTGAKAGMEFEMIVPGAGNVDDGDQEPDLDSDERARSISDIREFFHDGDYNGRREVQRLEQELIDAYLDSDFLSEQKQEAWGDASYDSVKELVERDYEDELREQAKEEVLAQTDEFGTNAEELDAAVQERFDELFDAKVDEIMSDMGREYDEAYDEWNDNEWPNIMMDWESDWLESEGLETMWDVSQNYDISWPYWTNSGEEMDIDAIAEDFSNAVGKPVNASRSYHGARREAGHYVVEPDGSLEGDDSDDAGLEFVSPPMPIDELLSDLNKVKKWADRENCYTNDSTGLHINVSVPNFSRENLDYIKLALLMGDQYVLDQFGRAGNTYTKSAMGKIRDKIKAQPERAQEFLDKMRSGMGQLASKAIHSGATDKYTSINTKDGYIEFRSPGGDWLNANFDKIENTLLRFTVALSAAVNPQAYREEYLKKFYKLLDVKGTEDPLSYFARYAAGEMPRAALKSFVKQAQLQRRIAKDPTGGQQYWWNVSRPGYFASIEVVASSKEEAIDKAIEPGNYPDWARAKNTLEAKPIRPYDSSPVKATVGEPQPLGRSSAPTLNGRPSNPDGNWVIQPENDRSRVAYRFMAADRDDAALVARQWRQANPGQVWIAQRDDNRTLGQPSGQGSQSAAQPPGDAEGSIQYEMFDRTTDHIYRTYYAADDRMALDIGNRYRDELTAASGIGRGQVGLRRAPVRGSTVDLQRQRAAAAQQTGDNWSQDFERRVSQPAAPTGAGREFAGWRVLMPTGEEVYRFSGVGNSQADANRIAAEWLRNNGRGVSGEGFEVVPVWREA